MLGRPEVVASAWGSLPLPARRPAELHKISLVTSFWPHHHFPKALYFYRASCLLGSRRGLEEERWPRRWPLPAPLLSLLSALEEAAGPSGSLPPGAELEPLSPGGLLRGPTDLGHMGSAKELGTPEASSRSSGDAL